MKSQVLVASGLMLSLAGCAVLNIDVDVYKGPLANHKDVQLQQLAQFAIGAQPILVKLCEKQEGSEDEPKKDACRAKEEPKSPIGRQVQEILDLYDDLQPHDILAKIELLSKYFTSYVGAYEQAFPNPTDDANKKHWKDLQREMWPEFTSNHPAVMKAGDQKQKVQAALQFVKNAYEKFLSGESLTLADHDHGIRDQDLLLCAQAILYPLFTDNETRTQLLGEFDPQNPRATGLEEAYHVTEQGNQKYDQKCRLDLPYKGRAESRKKFDPTSATAEYEGLLKNDAELIAKHADLLFPNEHAEAKKQFINEVKTAAKSFLVTRQYAETILTTSLELFTLVKEPTPYFHKDKKELLLNATANLIAELIRPRYLWYALENAALPDSDKATIDRFRDYLQSTLGDSYRELHSPSPDLDARYSALLISRLKTDQSAVTAILTAHQALIKNFTSPDENRLKAIKFNNEGSFADKRLEYDADKAKWEHANGAQRRYGISYGEPPPKLRALQSSLTNLSQIPGLLHKGRSLEGIASLSKSYGEVINSSPPHTRLTKNNRLLEQKLHNTLIHFAQKILIIGNFDVLTDLPQQSAPLQELSSAVRSIFYRSENKKKRGVEERNRYSSVLQAIGNSILIQADELRARREHEDRLAARAGEELLAFEAALTKSAPQIMTDLIRGLEADLADIPKKTQAVDGQLSQATTDKQGATQLLEQKAAAHTSTSTTVGTTLTGLNQERDALKARQLEIETADLVLKKEFDSLKHALTISTPNSSADIPKIVTWLADQLRGYQEIDHKLDRWKQLNALHTYLTASGNQVAAKMKPYTDTNSFLSEASGAIRKYMSEFSDTLQTLDRKIKEQNSLVSTSAREMADAERRLKDSADKIAALTSEKTQIESDSPIKALALQKVTALRSDILTRTSNSSNPGAEAIILLIDTIGKERFDAQGNRTNEAGNLDKVMTLLRGKIPQGDPELARRLVDVGKRCKDHFDDTPGCKSSQEILDDVIGLLRHEYIQEVRTSGEGKGQAEKIQSALKAAWDLRSSMVYIRPSGSYLRSSFPSTSLQDDPVLSSENLLAEKALLHMPLEMPFRLVCQLALPKSSESICKDEDRGKLRAQTALDKQFWQNINRVRLTGGGYTNYVVAKDDIGNWYVKEVETDPKDIIKAAKKLALFGMGTAGASTLASAVSQKATEGEPSTDEQQKTPLQHVYLKYRAAYETENSKTVGQLKQMLGSDGIRKTIQLAWAGNPSLQSRLGDLNNVLSHAANQLDEVKTVLVNTKDDTERPIHIANALKSILRFHNDLQSSIQTMDIAAQERGALATAQERYDKLISSYQNLDKTDEMKTKEKSAQADVDEKKTAFKVKADAAKNATNAVKDACFEALSHQLQNIKAANKQYETSLMFIGEVRDGGSKK